MKREAVFREGGPHLPHRENYSVSIMARHCQGDHFALYIAPVQQEYFTEVQFRLRRYLVELFHTLLQPPNCLGQPFRCIHRGLSSGKLLEFTGDYWIF